MTTAPAVKNGDRRRRRPDPESAYRRLVEALPLVVYTETIDERGVSNFYVSPQWTCLFGLRPVHAIQDWTDQLHPDDRDRVVTEWERVKAGGGAWRQEYRLVTPGARTLWVREEATVTTDEAGRAISLQGFILDVSDLKQAARESERLLRTVIDAVPGPIFVKDCDGRFRLVNRSTAETYGRTVEEMADVLPAELHDSPEAFERYHATDLQVIDGGDEIAFDDSFVDHTGELRWYQFHKILVTLPDGDVCALAVGEEITTRKRLEEELAQSRQFLRTVIDTDPNSVYVKDPEGRYVLVNAAAATRYGVPVEEIVGRRQTDLGIFPEDVLEQIRTDDRLILETGRAINRIEQIAFGGGEARSFETHKTPIALPGAVRGVLGVSRDITDQRRAEQALRESERFYRSILDSDPSPIAVKDQDGRFIFVNAETARLYGKPVEEITGAFQRDVHRSRHEVDEYLRDDAEVLDSGLPLLIRELQFTAPDGTTQWYETHKVPVTAVDGRRAILVVERDVTGRKLAEEGLRRSEEDVRRLNADLERRVAERTAQLETANRELESFSYSVSHDLRAPLRSIDGFSHALLEDYGDRLDEHAHGYLDRVRRAAQRMGELIDDLLNLSRLTRGALNEGAVNLTELATSVTRALQAADPGRQVECRIAEGVTARGDARLLRAALENLLGNAWKFTAGHERARIEFGTEKDGDRVVYFVRDDGAGFDMAYAARLFNPFQRLHTVAEFEGSGIGLATVQRIIRRHGGETWAEGAPEQGATFYFTLGRTGGEDADDQ